MTLRLTPLQYRTLVRAIFLARNTLNYCNETDETPIVHMRSLQKEIYSARKQFEAEEMFDETSNNADWQLSLFEEQTLLSIQDFAEDTAFWDILIDRLILRDISEQYTESQWYWTSQESKDKIYNKLNEEYSDEFYEMGISNVRVARGADKKTSLPSWNPAEALLKELSEDGITTPPPNVSKPNKDLKPGKIIRFPTKKE